MKNKHSSEDFKYTPTGSFAIGADEAMEAYGFDQDFLWKRVTDGSIRAYFYVHQKMGIRYKGASLCSKFYELSWPDLYILGTNFCPEMNDKDTIHLDSLDGELEEPLPVVRHAIRFDADDIFMLANPDRDVLDIDLKNAQQISLDEIIESFDFDIDSNLEDVTEEKKPSEATTKEYASTALMKIVAILAYRYAQKDNSCRIGNRINANQIEEMLKNEAQKLGIDSFGLASCRKKISECLKEFNIPAIEPNKDD
ncbi:hypothetical protein [Endozoicomonas ascidiicola]|uniref:hypothetical protein n=1 Tax=Endozoicomonas ascidiicola TaxID=1698521 RepID=UPI00083773D8|nr:hypothetical protein [Endozoicomonas ascidiicola]